MTTKKIIIPLLFILSLSFAFSCFANTNKNTLHQEKQLFEQAIKQAKSLVENCQTELSSIYPNGLKATQFPKVRVDHLISLIPNNIPLFSAKLNNDSETYGWIGEKTNGTRYAILGTNIFAFDADDSFKDGYKDINNQFNQELKSTTKQLFYWLLKTNTKDDIFKSKLRILAQSKSVKKDLLEWFSDNKIKTNWEISTNLSKLKKDNYDIFISKNSKNKGYIQAIKNKRPVLIWKDWLRPDKSMLDYFGLQWSWYKGKKAGNWSSIKQQCGQASPAGKILSTLNSLYENQLNFTYTSKACPKKYGPIICNPKKLKNSQGKTLYNTFSSGASIIRKQLEYLDKKNKDVFKQDANWNLLKSITLLADKLRAKIHYPLDKKSSKSQLFYQAYFADHVINYAWANNTMQIDMGDFSHKQIKINQLKTTTETLVIKPSIVKEWRSSGLYLPPGKKIELKRLDASASLVTIKFNFLRPKTSRVWSKNQYSRPAFLQSPEVPIKKGRTYSFSSPYGGPIYISTKTKSSNMNDLVKLIFNGIVKHPVLNDTALQNISTFTKRLKKSPFNWVDIVTPHLEIHTLKSNLLQSISSYNGDLKRYINELNQNLIINNFNLAGFIGEGLSPLNQSTKQFCQQKGLDCKNTKLHQKPKLQHFNSDIHASCGTLCAGYPIDTSGPIKALGWGEVHELGHNLQHKRFNIYAKKSKETSNNIFPIYMMSEYARKNKMLFFPKVFRPYHNKAFSLLQKAIKQGIKAGEKHPLWSEKGKYKKAFERLAFYIQLVYINQSWDIYTIMYLIDRQYSHALSSKKLWDSQRKQLGFSNYTRKQAKNISAEDFMYISTCYFSHKNYLDYFNAWGILVSDKAEKQAKINGYKGMMPAQFYHIDGNKIYAKIPNGKAKTSKLDGKSK